MLVECLEAVLAKYIHWGWYAGLRQRELNFLDEKELELPFQISIKFKRNIKFNLTVFPSWQVRNKSVVISGDEYL